MRNSKTNKQMKLAQLDIQEFLLEHSARFFKKGMSHDIFVTLLRSRFSPRKLQYAFMTALSLSVAPCASANAQQFSSIVAFGDSYADTGRIWEIMATTPPYGSYYLPSLNPLYPYGRFSDETNYVDTLASIYGISQENYALGGAQTGSLKGTSKKSFLIHVENEYQQNTIPQ